VAAGGLLFLLFVDPANLLMLVQLTSEESFLMPAMALAGALLFGWRSQQWLAADFAVFAIIVGLLPLTKSSALPAAAVLAAIALLTQTARPALRWLPAGALVAAVMAWGTFTWASGGHFALGSSLNGYNLHQGYNEHYGEIAPRYHPDLMVARGQIKLTAPVANEWEFDKQFQDRAMAFVRQHPLTSLEYLGIKIYVALFKLTPEYRPEGGEDGFFLPKHLIVTAGLVFDRLLLWGTFLYAASTVWRTVQRGGWRALRKDPASMAATAVIAVTLSWTFPFIVAFSSYRHIVPLYYFLAAYMASRLLGGARPAPAFGSS
jgi:hypothetical protein